MKVQRTPNRLHKIILQTCKPMCLSISMANPPWLWHARLGHLNFQAQICEGYILQNKLEAMVEKEIAHKPKETV